MYHNKGGSGGPSSEEIHQLMSKRFDGTAPGARTIRRYVNDYKLVGVSPIKQGSPGNIPPASFESLCVAVESYISIMQLNRRCGNDIGKKELAQIVNGVVDSDAVYKAKNYKLLRRISLYKGIDLLGGKMFSQEARRIQWTRHKYICWSPYGNRFILRNESPHMRNFSRPCPFAYGVSRNAYGGRF